MTDAEMGRTGLGAFIWARHGALSLARATMRTALRPVGRVRREGGVPGVGILLGEWSQMGWT